MSSINEQVEKMRSYPDQASDTFRRQLRDMKAALGGLACDNSNKYRSEVVGIDRSRELNPIARPALRTMALIHPAND